MAIDFFGYGLNSLKLRQNAIHEDFWKKTSPMREHIFFNDENFHKKAGDAVEAVTERYEENVLRNVRIFLDR